MLRKFALLFVFFLAFHCLVSAQATRHFTFHYAFTIQDVAAGQVKSANGWPGRASAS